MINFDQNDSITKSGQNIAETIPMTALRLGSQDSLEAGSVPAFWDAISDIPFRTEDDLETQSSKASSYTDFQPKIFFGDAVENFADVSTNDSRVSLEV